MVVLMAQTLEQRVVRKVLTTEPPLTFTAEIRYHPEDKGYSAECLEMDAVAWGETYEEAVENLLDVMVGFAEATMKLAQEYPNIKDKSLNHARFIATLDDEVKLR